MINSIIQGDNIAYKLNFDFDISNIEFISYFKQNIADDHCLLIKKFIAPENINSNNGILYIYFTNEETNKLIIGNIWFQMKMIIKTTAPKIITLWNDKIKIIPDITNKTPSDI